MYLNNNICCNCKYWKEKATSSIYMGKQPEIEGSCMFLVNGRKIRGMTKESYFCDDFVKGNYYLERVGN